MANKGFVGIFANCLEVAKQIFPNDETAAYDYAKIMKTQIAVSKACDYFTERGYSWNTPQKDQQGFDWDAIVCRPGGEPKKVQVKSAGYCKNFEKGTDSWEVNLKSGHFSKDSKHMDGGTCRKVPHDFDLIFILDGDGKQTIMTQDEALKKPDGTYRVHSIKVKRSHNNSQAKIDFS